MIVYGLQLTGSIVTRNHDLRSQLTSLSVAGRMIQGLQLTSETIHRLLSSVALRNKQFIGHSLLV